jgi:hypothetical protein
MTILCHSQIRIDVEDLEVITNKLNMKGVEAYEMHRFDDALSYFNKSCVLSQYGNPGYITNLIRTMTINEKPFEDRKNVLLQGLINSPSSSVLYDQLIRLYMNYSLISMSFFIMALNVLINIDNYNVWNQLVEYSLGIFFNYFNPNTILIDSSISPGLYMSYFDLIRIGLDIFPNCPRLLYLNSIILFYEEDYVCAHQSLNTSFDLISKFPSIFTRNSQHLMNMEHNLKTMQQMIDGQELSNDLCKPNWILSKTRVNQLSYHFEPNMLNSTIYDILLPFAVEQNLTMESHNIQYGVSAPRRKLKLHIGCSMWQSCARYGWIVVDAIQNVSTHVVTTIDNLSIFENDSVDQIYSSHTLEHLSHTAKTQSQIANESQAQLDELCSALLEWHRILSPTGRLDIAVPDLEVLSKLFVNPSLNLLQKKLLMTGTWM